MKIEDEIRKIGESKKLFESWIKDSRQVLMEAEVANVVFPDDPISMPV